MRRFSLRPDLAVFLSTIVWGTMWMPAREMNALEWMRGAPLAGSFLVATLVLLPMALKGGRWRAGVSRRNLIPGFCMALAIVLYLEGLMRSDVARVVLLFYLLPVWSAIFDRVIKGRGGSVRRAAGIVMGLFGMLVVFHDGTGLPLPRNLGDYMGLASGFIWALGFVFSESDDGDSADGLFAIVFINVVLAVPMVLLVAWLPGDRVAITAGLELEVLSGGGWLLVFGLAWVLPSVALTVHGARHLPASQVAIFLMMEVVISLATAAYFLDEAFGSREMLGAALIIGASLLEVAPVRRRSSG